MASNADPYQLLRVLEEVAREHASTVRALNKVINRLRHDLGDEDLQLIALRYIRRLRSLRTKLLDSLGEAVILDNVDDITRENIATLSEYMVIVGAVYERDLLRKTVLLAKRGARILNGHLGDIEADMEQLERLVSRLEDIVQRYY